MTSLVIDSSSPDVALSQMNQEIIDWFEEAKKTDRAAKLALFYRVEALGKIATRATHRDEFDLIQFSKDLKTPIKDLPPLVDGDLAETTVEISNFVKGALSYAIEVQGRTLDNNDVLLHERAWSYQG